MTLSIPDQCLAAAARSLTDQLRQSLTQSWELLVEAYQRRAWSALGYRSWDAYTDAELGDVRLRLPREERREVVASMTEAGMSTRAIGSALGVDQRTVAADRRSGAENSAPEPAHVPGQLDLVDVVDAEIVDEQPAPRVQGTDGKSYPAPVQRPAAPRRRALTQSFWDVAHDLARITERATRLAADDRFPANAAAVSSAHRADIARARDALQALLDQLPVDHAEGP